MHRPQVSAMATSATASAWARSRKSPTRASASSKAVRESPGVIVFSHANSFPAGTYQALFRSLRARGHTVRAVEQFDETFFAALGAQRPAFAQGLMNLVKGNK